MEEIRSVNKYFFPIHNASVHIFSWTTCFITTDYDFIHVLKINLSHDNIIYMTRLETQPAPFRAPTENFSDYNLLQAQ
jgi:hypothetical protein